MKNIVKLLSLMLIAGTLMVSCTEKPEIPDGPVTPTVYTVQVNTNDATLGTVSISPLKTTYTEGDTVILTATPAEGAKFLNWNGNITDNPYTYVVKENITFTANFEALPLPTYSATFNGSAIDMSGFYSADCAADGSVWLFQAANAASGNQISSLPYLVLWMTGATPNDLAVHSNTEFYYETGYTLEGTQYADYQFKNMDNINCTEMDLTAYKLSMTSTITFYNCGPLINGTAATVNECPTGTLAITMNNMAFEPQSGKAALKKAFLM